MLLQHCLAPDDQHPLFLIHLNTRSHVCLACAAAAAVQLKILLISSSSAPTPSAGSDMWVME
jgi:hypothetical protein